MPGPNRPHNSKRSPKRVQAAQRQRQAMQLRVAGASYSQIAAELGYTSRAGAEKAIIAGLREFFRQPAQDLLALELQRCDRLQLAVWPAAMEGDVQAVLACLKVMERRSKYAGLDAPVKTDSRIAAFHQVDVQGAVMVLPGTEVNSTTADFVAAMRALRGEDPFPAIEGTSTPSDVNQDQDQDDDDPE
jgi:hypothetical protein